MTLFEQTRSVRKTLLILLLPAVIILMGMAWLVHGLLLERMSRTFVESRLEDEAAFLVHQIRLSGTSLETLQTGEYFEEVFHHAFAIQASDQILISPSQWDSVLRPLLAIDQEGTLRRRFPNATDNDLSDILAVRKVFQLGDVSVVVIVSEDMEMLYNSQSELHVWTAVVSMLLILLLVAVIWIGITLAMRPVILLQTALGELQSGVITRIDERTPEEFQPLVRQLNQLLDTLDQRLERSRDALSNLSHSVKTPIAAVRQILEDADRSLPLPLRLEMAARLSDIDRQLEAEMRRSRFAGPQAGKSAQPVKQARDLLWMLGRLYPEKTFELSTVLSEGRRWPIEEYDLNEVLGNLLDNAGKWSRRCVELLIEENGRQMRIVISDDGPGVAASALGSLGARGLRLDEQTPGHGLGLAIVSEIVQRYQGSLVFTQNGSQGFVATVEVARTQRTDRAVVCKNNL